MLVIGPLIFVHELGHYLVGRWFGVKADVFSIGFGRELVGWTDRRGTRWKVGWLPLGGYVKFAGDMNPASQPSANGYRCRPRSAARTFQAKPLWQRVLIVAAGPSPICLFAIVVFTAFFATFGNPTNPPIIAVVEAGFAAASGRRRPRRPDRHASAAGHRNFDEFADYVLLRPGEATRVSRATRRHQRIACRSRSARDADADQFGNSSRDRTLRRHCERGHSSIKLPLSGLPGQALASDPGHARSDRCQRSGRSSTGTALGRRAGRSAQDRQISRANRPASAPLALAVVHGRDLN